MFVTKASKLLIFSSVIRYSVNRVAKQCDVLQDVKKIDLLFLYFCFVCLFLIEHATSEGTWNWLGKASSSPVMKSRSCFDWTVVKWFSVKCHQAERLSGAGSLRLNPLHMTMTAPIPTSSDCVF